MINWFLDMCVIIYYAYNSSDKLAERAKKFVENKGNSTFTVCYYILEINLPKWIKRKWITLEELERKIKDPSYIFGSSSEARILLPKDRQECEKLLSTCMKAESSVQFIEDLRRKYLLAEIKINFFINKLINNKVIPVSEIDFELKSSFFTYLENNDSDARTLASAVQQHNKENLIILTGDKKHWTKQLLDDAVSIHPTLRKKYSKIPEIKYLQDL